jgi:TRAP-type C4-dicarboxylate transport system substrate-binding protein
MEMYLGGNVFGPLIPVTKMPGLPFTFKSSAELAQRKDIDKLNADALDVLRSKGMIVNEADTSGFRRPLAAFYERWKEIYGAKGLGVARGAGRQARVRSPRRDAAHWSQE